MRSRRARGTARPPSAGWWRAGATAVLAGLAVGWTWRTALGHAGLGPVWIGGGAGLLGVVGVALRHGAQVRRDGENAVWTWFARAVLALAGGFALEVLVLAGAARGLEVPRPGAGLAAGMIAASAMAYQGLVHWNRYRTAVSDPGDWLNGAGAILCFMALGGTVLTVSDAPLADLPVPGLMGWLAQLGALVMLLGTAATVAVVGGLATDARSRIIAAALGGAIVTQGAALVAGAGRAGGDAQLPPAMGLAAWSWLAVAVAVAIAARLRPHLGPPRHATAGSTTAGAAVVLVVAVVVLLVDALAAEDSLRWSALLAAAACATAALRLMSLVREMGQTALSRREARTDDLTGLANRRAVVEHLVKGDPQGTCALVLVDLVRFRRLNDRLGHALGDEVLRVVGARLGARVGPAGLVARLAGDEFAISLPGASVSDATDLARELLEVLREAVELPGQTVVVDASVGVAGTALCGPGLDLWRCADAAVRASQRAGGGSVSVYDEVAEAGVRADRRLAEDVRMALEDRARLPGGAAVFPVHYQPQIEIATGRVTGVEALVRWKHPELGLLPPAAFLGHVERQGLMRSLTLRVLDQAMAEVSSWRAAGADIQLSVNLSTSCLTHPKLPETLSDSLNRYGLPPEALVVEVTETSLISDDIRAVEVARSLEARGISISIDDYGTGYSSLARLNALPTNELKLDRSFTRHLLSEPRTAAIVAGTVDLAHRLGLRVVAEGVEDQDTLEALRALGCDVSQGYLHARPLPASEIRAWLAEHRLASAGA